LIVLCGALFLDWLDVSMVGVALPDIRNALGLSTSSLQWVVSGYVLGYGGLGFSSLSLAATARIRTMSRARRPACSRHRSRSAGPSCWPS
jgi:MFS family permease